MDCMMPVPAVKGGAVSTLIESILKENEEKKQISITLFTLSDKESEIVSKIYPHTTFINIHTIPIIETLDKLISPKKILWKLYVIKKARRYIKNKSFDAIILQNNGSLLRIFKSKKLQEKYKGNLYYHLHNDIPQNADKEILRHFKIILISRYLLRGVTSICGRSAASKCFIVQNGINIHKFCKELTLNEKLELRKTLNITLTQKILIFVGRINPQKGINELLDAIKVMNSLNIVLLVIGSSSFGMNETSMFERQIKQKCSGMGEKVRLIGFIHNDELWKYYQLADIAVLPSMWEEPAGLTMIEAVASGTPVISTNSGGIPEYISDNCGILIKRDKNIVQSLTEAITTILEHEYEWQQKIAAGKKEICKQYSEEAFYQRFINCIENENRNSHIR